VKPNRIYVDHGLTSTNRAPWSARSAGRVPVRRKQPKLKPAQEATWSSSGEPAKTPAPSWPSRSPSPSDSARVSGHVFVDETKGRHYLLVAGVVMPPGLDPVRRTLRTLVMPGQRRLHMAKERDQRRRQIVDAFLASGVSNEIDFPLRLSKTGTFFASRAAFRSISNAC